MKIFIDAGHGFETAGKRTVDGMREYEFNRAVANEMKLLLDGFEHVTVQFSHSDKQDVPLHDRTALANQEDADLFVSIHANAHGNGREWTSVEGIETYVYLSKPEAAYALAKIVQANLINSTSRTDRGVKTGNFHVLKETNMTAILCECGFMTNQSEAYLLRTQGYRHTCAAAIVKGIVSFYNLEKKVATQTENKELFKVQLGAFEEKKHAVKLADDLKRLGYEAMIVSTNHA